jgi:thiol-disulfide isomerase/thioredoxin
MKTIVGLIMLVTSALSQAAAEGDIAPLFTLQKLDKSGSYSLAPGKVIYLDFWASWCAPCRVSFPEIIALQNDLGSDSFEVIAVTVDENPAAAKRFLRRYDIPYQILSDPDGVVAGRYELPGMPTSFVIDPQGLVSLRHSGFKPGDMTSIRHRIHQLLETAL